MQRTIDWKNLNTTEPRSHNFRGGGEGGRCWHVTFGIYQRPLLFYQRPLLFDVTFEGSLLSGARYFRKFTEKDIP